MKWLARHKKTKMFFLVATSLFIAFLCIPAPKFDKPYSTILTAKDGELLGAKIADDGQWRFPASNSYSSKYIACLTEYEDRWFFLHPGFNPVSFAKALIDNIRAGEVIRGGSTLSMQVVRMSRDNPPRTYKEKLIEVVLALRLELHYSKKSILDIYAANAPFGGNVVGIDAAAWRYFHTTPDELSWAEAATLAVLPNAPALIHPGRSRELLEQKRNELLLRMQEPKAFIPKRFDIARISKEDSELAMMEDIPSRPFEIPMLAYHYLTEQDKLHHGEHIGTTIDAALQKSVIDIMQRQHQLNKLNSIDNAAVYIVDYLNDEIVSYVGNNIDADDAKMVDMVRAQRSTGSILKPFLFAAMLDEGTLLPQMVVPDIPMSLSGFTPKNYSGEYWGAVTAERALQSSLNAPFVHLLREYSQQRFHALLKQMPLNGIVFPPEHYGLSLIIGGAEASLFDITNAYAKMGRKLASHVNESFDVVVDDGITPFSAEAVAETFHVMLGLTRPVSQTGWSGFASSRQVAWKTGTSYGFKDAWAVGITDRYVVGVWVGNADGEGRPGITGVGAAAPLLFEVIGKLNDRYTYPANTSESIEIEVCAESGYPKSEYCTDTKKTRAVDVENKTGVCPYHKKVFLDESRQYRVKPDCYPVEQKRFEVFYVLPPVMEWFYKKHSPLYKPLPAFYPGCGTAHPDDVMAFVYPKDDAKITIPVGIRGDRQMVVFEIAHRNPQKTIFWTLDDAFLGKTRLNHQMPIDVEHGIYTLRCVDEDGIELRRKIIVQ